VKPLISFLWLGVVLMVLGGLVTITDRRYRQPIRATAPAPAPSPVPQPATETR
jgi:cytochrome c-type biogenesis protein CcmF